ncbi:MAG: hypothetical protein LUC38_05180 [Oscillospiraceae bacterium]|nr:hypothetical protein [Ruminococcus sp.]MCD8345338.1 hypothetical protein [Oscillospiraceae bacterium]
MFPTLTKPVFIVFFATDLKTGRFIRTMTRHRFNHAAISLDGMRTFYSFSRLYIDHPMIAGLVVESPKRYLMTGKTVLRAYKIDVDIETYGIIKSHIEEMLASKRDYVYNYISCGTYMIGRRFHRQHAFTCVEFVRDTLVSGGVLFDDHHHRVGVDSLERELSSCGYEMSEGTAKDFLKRTPWGEDPYLDDCGGRIAVMREASRRLYRMVRG